MIISASRRTDIPAFYSRWFLNRLRAEFVYVRSAFNHHQISEITLRPDLIDCIVFWTKNPHRIFPHLKEIDALGYPYYFQFTLTGYGKKIEKNLPDKEVLIGFFKKLSDRIGPEKVIWRYDPIILADQVTDKYHMTWFKHIAGELTGYTEKCITSFLDMYKKCERNMASLQVVDIDNRKQMALLTQLKEIAEDHHITLETCAEEIDTSELGIFSSKCIDDTLIARIIGEDIEVKKDPSQRKKCGCVESIDIGTYDTCLHHCLYCYANHSFDTARKNHRTHRPRSPLLFGEITEKQKITRRKICSLREKQRNLF